MGAYDELRALALSYPGAFEDFPWGEAVAKVGNAAEPKKGKLFVFLPSANHRSLTVKLPHTHEDALALPFVSPTRYGLGAHGWVTCAFSDEAELPVELLSAFIDESYRAVAPKRLVKQLEASKPSE